MTVTVELDEAAIARREETRRQFANPRTKYRDEIDTYGDEIGDGAVDEEDKPDVVEDHHVKALGRPPNTYKPKPPGGRKPSPFTIYEASGRPSGRVFGWHEFHEPVWERQEQIGETIRRHQMFLAYASLPPSSRSVEEAWRHWAHGTKQEGKRTSRSFLEISKSYRWEERAYERDKHELSRRYRVWTERDWEWRERDYEVGTLMRDAAIRSFEQVDENGSPVIPDISSATQMAQVASNLQKNSVPGIGDLTAAQAREIMAALPPERRANILKIISTTMNVPIENVSSDGEIIEGEVKVLPAPGEAQAVPRKRGRPRKNPEEAQVKRPRGRPRKNPVE